MPSGARKRKASKRKNNKKGESQDSNNPNHHSINNNYSTHSHGSVDDSKSVEERDSDVGEFEREEEEEEEIVDQREVDTVKGEGLKEEVVQVEKEDKSLLNGSGSADFSAVHVAMEEKSLENGSGSADFSSVHAAEEIVAPAREKDVVARNFDVEDKEVAVVEEEEKSVIAAYLEHKVENPSSLVIDEKEGIVDCVEEETVEELKESVEAHIIEEKEDLVKGVVELAPAEFISAGVESLVMPVPADVVDSEFKKNVSSSFSRISDDKNELSIAMEAEKSEQIETPVKVSPVDDEDESSDAPAVSNGVVEDVKPLETDNSGAAVAINTSRGVDNGKELEIQTKPSEEQTPISTNPLPVRRTSWMGCCGLFEVFSGAKR